jgi:hypothetical protein
MYWSGRYAQMDYVLADAVPNSKVRLAGPISRVFVAAYRAYSSSSSLQSVGSWNRLVLSVSLAERNAK